MKKLILVLTALMMVGCLSKRDSNGIPYDVHVIDSCEYIDGGHVYGIGHKGNCHFCEERRQKELEELIIKLKEK
jgi:hypothetical protein